MTKKQALNQLLDIQRILHHIAAQGPRLGADGKREVAAIERYLDKLRMTSL